MPNTNCLSGPAFSLIGGAIFNDTAIDFSVVFDSPADAAGILNYEWYLDNNLMIDQNLMQFAGQVTCGTHEIGVRILSASGWSGIKRLEFATCRTATALLFYGVDRIDVGASTTYYILQLYSDGFSKNVTEDYVFSSTPGGSFNGNVFTADTDLTGFEDYEVTISAVKNAEPALHKQVTVVNTTPIVQVSLEIIGAAAINEGSSASYTVLATYSNGTQQDQTSSYIFSSSIGTFTGNILSIPVNAVVGDSRSATIYASQSGIPVLSKQITINDTSVRAGILVVDLYGSSDLNLIGLIDNAEVAGSHIAAYTGHNTMPSGAAPSSALILASGFNSPTWRFEFNIKKLVMDYPQTQEFVFYIKGRANVTDDLSGAFSVKTSDGVMTLSTTPAGVLMPGVIGGTNHFPLTNVLTKIFAGANGSYLERDLSTILRFVYNATTDKISYTTFEEPIVIDNFDFMAVRYHWVSGDGSDLDVLVGLEQNNSSFDRQYVGFGANVTVPYAVPSTDQSFLWWALDNRGSQGYEGVLIGIKQFIEQNPSSPNIVEIGLYAVWFGQPISGNFSVELVTYLGGTMSAVNNDFINAGGVQTSSNTVNVNTMQRKVSQDSATYFKVGTVKYNKTTKTATIQIN